jgi:hypothetical protein
MKAYRRRRGTAPPIFHSQAALPPGEVPRYPLNRRTVEVQSGSRSSSTCFPINYIVTVLQFDAVKTQKLEESLNKKLSLYEACECSRRHLLHHSHANHNLHSRVTSSAAYKQTYTLLIVAKHTYGLPSRPADENLVKVSKHAAYSCSRISERNPVATEICHFYCNVS